MPPSATQGGRDRGQLGCPGGVGYMSAAMSNPESRAAWSLATTFGMSPQRAFPLTFR